jgi:hypothetical protein
LIRVGYTVLNQIDYSRHVIIIEAEYITSSTVVKILSVTEDLHHGGILRTMSGPAHLDLRKVVSNQYVTRRSNERLADLLTDLGAGWNLLEVRL